LGRGSTEIANNTKGSSEMGNTRMLHKLGKMLNIEAKVWTSMSQIIQFTHKSAISKRVSNGIARIKMKLTRRIQWRKRRWKVVTIIFREQIKSEFPLT